LEGAQSNATASPQGCLGRWLHKQESSLLNKLIEVDTPPPADVSAALNDLRSTNKAFVVFRTEGGRDAAVNCLEDQGFEFERSQVKMDSVSFEPASTLFHNMHFSHKQRVYRVLMGIGVIVLALMIWSGAFYLPYAHYMLTFTSDQGSEPGVMYSITFSLVVIIGNQIMYFVCRAVALRAGFQVQGELETCYMVLYSIAIVFNVIVDLVVAYQMAYISMIRSGVRTHDGKLLYQVETGKEVFESYIMQKDLGGKLFSYFFPATCLLPFLFEPVMLYFLPLRAMTALVRRHPEISRIQAEDLFRASPMDLGRYADILVNVFLAVLVFLFPGGYTVLTFGALVLSHAYIYCYDHWRVLRAVPSFCVSSFILSNWSSGLLSVPCGILLATCVFKTNCNPGFPCAEDKALYLRCAAAFVIHIALHLLLLAYVVPVFGNAHCTASKSTYEECSQKCAQSWFTMNPVHCLRSKYIYEHDPPCDFCTTGKEHLLRRNKAIGQHFEAQAGD